uniref:Poly [ADP-ribose] polymerase n=1 Tax=Callorhinchus milii TaxID=7868 RepID=V9KQ97_CALMI
MPPKRKSASSATKGKKVKVEPAEDSFKTAVKALKAAPKEERKAKIDAHCTLLSEPNAELYADYDCMLNQTNIGNNNNKFYIIQLIEFDGSYFCFNRWGRVGEVGQFKLNTFCTLEDAMKDFEKKFKDKTKNDWAKRDSFVAHSGKYTMIDVQHDGEEQTVVKTDIVDGIVKKQVKPCTLDSVTQSLITLIFSHDMFREQMQTMNIDVKKMPLGKLSKQQIAKGFEVLEEIEKAQKSAQNKNQLEKLSSKFYTSIPHNFGRMRPPVIDTPELVQAKKDMLLVLADIELAQSLQAGKEKNVVTDIEEVPHPLDEDYQLLKCKLSVLLQNSEEFKIIKKYVDMTGPKSLKILHIWQVDREGEDDRFENHSNIENRRLLWHGTNIAVVAAILKTGLRIMPHSGGRVGSGIYFASENSKSAGYVGCARNSICIMFLNEVALGKEYIIDKDDCSLKVAPEGFDCVVARGYTEPDPSQDKELVLDGKKVMVPQGKPKKMKEYNNSRFSQSEYVIYKESQARIRYMLQMKF